MKEEQVKELIEVLGLNQMSELEQTETIKEIGDLVMESALLRLSAEMDEEQAESLDQFMESDPSPETLMDFLFNQHKDFGRIWDEEVKAFREDALSILEEK